VISRGKAHCNALQHIHTAPHCTTLQHSATHCNTLQNQDLLTWEGSLKEEKYTLDFHEKYSSDRFDGKNGKLFDTDGSVITCWLGGGRGGEGGEEAVGGSRVIGLEDKGGEEAVRQRDTEVGAEGSVKRRQSRKR